MLALDPLKTIVLYCQRPNAEIIEEEFIDAFHFHGFSKIGCIGSEVLSKDENIIVLDELLESEWETLLLFTQTETSDIESLKRLHYFHDQFRAEITVSVRYSEIEKGDQIIKWNAYNKITEIAVSEKAQRSWNSDGIFVLRNIKENKKIVSELIQCEDFVLNSMNVKNSFVIPFAKPKLQPNATQDFQSIYLTESNNNTLFIDRDGVINRRIVDSYVTKPDEFELLPGVMAAMSRLSTQFSRIVVVTNQQGIGKGLMGKDDVDQVHDYMISIFEKSGVVVDAIYYCPDLAESNSENRKPNVGMAINAKDQFEEIDWSNCLMIGDSTSDIEFGLRMGMYTVLVGDKSSTALAHEKHENISMFVSKFKD